jgi:hypothetical protein
MDMKYRADHKTAYYFDLALRIKESWGELASIRFLEERKVPVKVALRVVSTIFKKHRVKSQPFV